MKKHVFSLLVVLVSLFFCSCSKEDVATSENDTVENELEENEVEENEVAVEPFKRISSITLPGNKGTDVWGFSQDGKEYAIMGNTSPENREVFILEVYNPLLGNSTDLASRIPYAGFDMKVWQNYLYVVDGTHDGASEESGMIYDIKDPKNPVAVGNFPTSHNIFIDNRGYLYITGRHLTENEVETEFGITIYDLNNDPTQPELIWTSDETESHDISVIGNRMFDFHGEMGTFIYDVSNPSAPNLLGSAKAGVGYDHNGWPTEDGNYLYITNEYARSQFNFTTLGGPDIAIWDISDVSNPRQVGEIHDDFSRVHNLYIVDHLAYVSYYSAGLKVFDVSNPENPVLVYENDTNRFTNAELNDGFNGAFGVYPFSNSGMIYVSYIASKLMTYQPVENN